MTTDDKSENGLETLFEKARKDAHDLPPGLAQRMQADALRAQADHLAGADPVDTVAPGLWGALRDAIGGWAGLSGLAAACAAGIWIGVVAPAGLPDPLILVQPDQSELDVFGENAFVTALSVGEG